MPLTLRNEIASCCEKAYRSLPIQQIATMLFFNKSDDILAFASQVTHPPTRLIR